MGFKTRNVLKTLLDSKLPVKIGLHDIRRALKTDFAMRFGHCSSTNYVVQNRQLAERRTWVSRLVSYFFSSEALVISFDESPLKVEVEKGRQWVPQALRKAKQDYSVQHFDRELLEASMPRVGTYK